MKGCVQKLFIKIEKHHYFLFTKTFSSISECFFHILHFMVLNFLESYEH